MSNIPEKKYLHNFGSEENIPEGAIALCGAVNDEEGPGVTDPPADECCPTCLTLTEIRNQFKNLN